jgi:peptide/nickel transport system permease protein
MTVRLFQGLLQRLLGSLGVVFGAVTLVFLILNWLPGDAAELIAGEEANTETIQRVRQQLGTDRPLGQQYVDYLGGLLRGDLGKSYVSREPVASRLAAQLPSTALLTLCACGVAVFFGVGLGVLSARHAGRWLDPLIQSLGLWLHSMPVFWLGILLILLFSVTLSWLPVIGNSPATLVLPATALGLWVSVPIMRLVATTCSKDCTSPTSPPCAPRAWAKAASSTCTCCATR